MCGLVHSSCLTVPVNVIGLCVSNSAATAWGAIAGTDAASSAAPNRPTIDVLNRITVLLVDIVGNRPALDCPADDLVEIILLAGVLHDDVGIRLDAPRPDVHPVASEG